MALSAISPSPLERTYAGLAELLRAAFPPAKFMHQVVPAKLTRTNWPDLTRVTPFVGLGWDGIRRTRDGQLWIGVSRWSVWLTVSNSGSDQARLLGDGQGPGLATMTTLAVAVLNGRTIPGVGSVSAAEGNAAIVELEGENRATALVSLEVGLDLALDSVIEQPADLGEFLRMGLTWNFKPGAPARLDELDTIRSDAA